LEKWQQAKALVDFVAGWNEFAICDLWLLVLPHPQGVRPSGTADLRFWLYPSGGRPSGTADLRFWLAIYNCDRNDLPDSPSVRL